MLSENGTAAIKITIAYAIVFLLAHPGFVIIDGAPTLL